MPLVSSLCHIDTYPAPIEDSRKVSRRQVEANATIAGVTARGRHDSYYCVGTTFSPESLSMRRAMMCSRASVLMSLSLLVSALACGGSSEMPSMPTDTGDPSTVTVADPIGDTFGLPAGLQWDIVALAVARETDGITVRLDFANEVAMPVAADPNALVGLVELDLDQNRATGKLGYVDQLRKDGGATEMGVDAAINISQIAPDSTLLVYDM